MQRGNHLSQVEVRRIISLLKNTDLKLAEIAERMRCSRSAVGAINRRHQIRDYAGLRSGWSVSGDAADADASVGDRRK